MRGISVSESGIFQGSGCAVSRYCFNLSRFSAQGFLFDGLFFAAAMGIFVCGRIFYIPVCQWEKVHEDV